MKTKQEMIDVIYEEIANKELSFGVRFIHKDDIHNDFKEENILLIYRDNLLTYIDSYDKLNNESMYDYEMDDNKIIGHPVLIGDMLEYLEKEITGPGVIVGCGCSGLGFQEIKLLEISNIWKYKRLPIESQSEDCIKYIYNLIKDENK